jgi:hypothetical protein
MPELIGMTNMAPADQIFTNQFKPVPTTPDGEPRDRQA